MSHAVVLASVLGALLVLVPIVAAMIAKTIKNRRTRSGSTPDDASAEGVLTEPADEEHLAESMTTRVLQAQVRALEQALEEAEAAATVAREEAQAAADHLTDVRVVEHSAVVARDVRPSLVAEVAPAPSTLVVDVPPALSNIPVRDLSLLDTVQPDVVLPVPPPTEPEVARGHRWFRRSAA